MSTTIIDLIRHGEPVGGKRYRGQIDDPLSDKGWQQMRDAVAGHRPWQQIITSPLSRCYDFACELELRYAIPMQVDERLKEIGFGTWEGLTSQEITRDDPAKITDFYRNPLVGRPEGAESLVDFSARVVSAWDDILLQFPGQHVLIVAHAGVIRMLVSHVLGMPLESFFRIQVANAGVTRIQLTRAGDRVFPQLVFHGGSL